MNPINRYLDITINNKEYKFMYTIKSIMMCEKALTTKSVLKTIIDMPLNYADTYEFFRWGIYGGGKQMNADEMENLFAAYLEEHNVAECQQMIMEALQASGVIGNMNPKK